MPSLDAKGNLGMIIPQYWAEARLQERVGKRSFTLRRFGWSDVSQTEAQTHAESRVKKAMAQAISGVAINRQERRRSYGLDGGLPIREEILERHGVAIITRNTYGARCLNHPNVMFADIDLELKESCAFTGVCFFISFLLSWWFLHTHIGPIVALFVGGFLSAILCPLLARSVLLLASLVRGGEEKQARDRIAAFLQTHPDWHLRLYRTPAGLRLLAMHRTFEPSDPVVAEFFKSVKVDPLYAQLCQNQQCFRARVSPKPWRMKLRAIMPRRAQGVWPVSPEWLPERSKWIETYERMSPGFASCRFIGALGSPTEHPEAKVIQSLHDNLCQATSELPLA